MADDTPTTPPETPPGATAPDAPQEAQAVRTGEGTVQEEAVEEALEAEGEIQDDDAEEDLLDDADRAEAGERDRSFAARGYAPAGTATRCGFVALIGAPNAGKSTLLNQLVGSKVSIVSRKVQTTRALIRGIAIEGDAQIVFVDTPGIFRPKRRLDRAMVTSAWGGAGDADVICLLVDARRGLDEDGEGILARLGDLRQPKALVLNKIDLIERSRLLGLAAEINERHPFDHTFMISALKGDGVERFRETLASQMPPGPWLYPEDQISDAPLRMLAAEITREKIYERLHEELPYESTVETDQWQVRPDGSVRIEQTIFVERDSQRKIVLGKGGQTIKAIGQLARREIAEAAECPVHLFLFVKVRENWADDPERYREMGLEFPRGG